MNFQIRISFLLSGLFILLHLPAQDLSDQEISRKIDSMVSDIRHLSDSLYGTDMGLINGEYYRYRHTGIDGHPYYRDNSWIRGTVTSGKREHRDLLLRYDILDDRVILSHTVGSETYMIALNKTVTDEFTLEEDHFIQLFDRDIVNNFPEPGYYQELYTGKVQLLGKRKKYISGSRGQQLGEFRSDPLRLIRKDGVYHKFNGRNSLLKILADRKEPVSDYIRSNAIDVRNAPDSDLVRILRYYDSLLSAEK